MSEPFHANDQIKNAIPYFKMHQICSSHQSQDEQDEDDLFSESNLFLSKKIKTIIQDASCSGKWSQKIEARLLTQILPEFKQKFPKRELGVSALKKVWAKVTHYYEKIQKNKDAFDKNGSLNLTCMIRESLKKDLKSSSVNPYATAQKIAIKLSECIASLEGKKLKWQHLAKMIWAVQKHLLKNLPAMEAKNPYQEYDSLDKLIVKIQLEIIATKKNLNFFSLKKEIIKTLKSYATLQMLVEKNQLHSTLSLLVATYFDFPSFLKDLFSLKERNAIELFIRKQAILGTSKQSVQKGEHPVELIQRILALYSIAEELPKEINLDALRNAIKTIKNEKSRALNLETNPILHVFINAQIQLMGTQKNLKREEENAIIDAYQSACTLPKLSSKQWEALELLIWKVIGDQEDLLSHISPSLLVLLHKELGNVFMNDPTQPLSIIINQTFQFLKKSMALAMEKNKIEDKVEIWAVQNDLLIRTVHFDDKNPLLKLMKTHWRDQNLTERTVQHESFIKEVQKHAISTFPILSFFKKALITRLWILYKYFWYHFFTGEPDSTYERFLLWHRILLKNTHPNWPEKKITQTLATLSNRLTPLAPYKNFL